MASGLSYNKTESGLEIIPWGKLTGIELSWSEIQALIDELTELIESHDGE